MNVTEKVDIALGQKGPTQDRLELIGLGNLLEELKPYTILEIGVAGGGSINIWKEFAHPDALILGVDINPYVETIKFQHANQKFVPIKGDTRDEDTVLKVKKELGIREVDFLFIDGSHAELLVRNDFERFAPLVKRGGMQ